MATTTRTRTIGSVLLLVGLLALAGPVRAEVDPVTVSMAVDPAAMDPTGPIPVSWATPETTWAEVFGQPAEAPVAQAAEAPIAQTVAFTPAAEPVQAVPAVLRPTVGTYRVRANEHVRFFLERFQTGYRRAVVESWLSRSGRYLPMILDVFNQKGLPEELVFTAMIESGFNPLAVSRAGAKGLWQFMAPTARRYGLRIDEWLDERLDPEKSTMAAARHLLDLYAVFGSWNLVQAAYNAGEMKVLQAVRAMGTSDFWTLRSGPVLREETKNFIPAIQAAA